ncbi:diguanylate cyclase [Rhizobium wenxiniae]|uniref:diguanylate cyclase n=1 Tax=Rhizobium wenxiniae TaxID=1737357 RepID=A0A7W9YEG3_9HYPH|nr:diguanylate cyclase [Rhizobium wenxiniae]MBB6166263.1 diguanylate cyclase (GGDEF)-like protein/PAS domain S-box-containing protein [Rhizobium wenxiniae]GGG22079.1 diguanylate cyclase [Rhizobium wenxiniae]
MSNSKSLVEEKKQTATGMVFCACVLGLLCLVIWDEYEGWASAVARIEHGLLQDAFAIGQHVDDSIQVAELALSDIITEIDDEKGSPQLQGKIVNVMKRQIGVVRRLDSLSFIGANGRLIATSVANGSSGVDFGDRIYFKYHSTHDSPASFVGPPVLDRLRSGWIITVSRRYNLKDGSYGGVVVATVSLRYLADFFQKFDIGANGTVLLVKGDGTILTRMPMNENILGTDMSGHDLFQAHLSRRTEGVYHYTSPVDGMKRISAYKKSQATGIVTQIAASRAETLTNWITAAQIRWLSFLAMFGLACVIGWRWNIQAKLRRISQRELTRLDEEIRVIAESSADLIQRLSLDGTREYVSQASLSLYGIPPADLMGRNMLEGLEEESASNVRLALQQMRNGKPSEKVTASRKLQNGRVIWVETTFSRCEPHPGSPASIVAVTRDITRQKEERDNLDALAKTDGLTGIANRRVLDERLSEYSAMAALPHPVSFLLIDADNFKSYNDQYGHDAGDTCLKAIAQALQTAVANQGDLAARYGGEEFALLLPGTDAPQAMVVAEGVRGAIEELCIEHAGNPPYNKATVSIGIATLSAGSRSDASSLVHTADQALYAAKSGGRNQCRS